MRRAKTDPTPEREAEVARLLEHIKSFAKSRRDVVAVGLAGSWARGVAGMESDVDLVVLTTEKRLYLDGDAWAIELGLRGISRAGDWGPLYTELRSETASGLEVEFGVAPPEWAATNPPDPMLVGEVGSGGLKTVYDPDGILKEFIRACEGLAG